MFPVLSGLLSGLTSLSASLTVTYVVVGGGKKANNY